MVTLLAYEAKRKGFAIERRVVGMKPTLLA